MTMDADQQKTARETTACLIKLCIKCGQNYTEHYWCDQCEKDARIKYLAHDRAKK